MEELQPVMDAVQDGLEWEALTDFFNGWSPYSGGWAPRAAIDPFGVVHLFGLAEAGTRTDGVHVMTLPSRFWPASASSLQFALTSYSPSAIHLVSISTDGIICYHNPTGSEEYFTLSGVSYATKLQ